MPNPEERDFGSEAVVVDPFAGTSFKATRRLGAGGTGEVFKVEHRLTGRTLVAKVLQDRHMYEPRLLQRFRVEAQVLAQLKHEHIVAVAGYEQTRDGRPFIVTEYLDGHTLADEMQRRGQFPIREAVRLMAQVLSGLAAAHAAGVVHRDIKPENLFLCSDSDGQLHAKIIDFGFARLVPGVATVEPLPAAFQTSSGHVVGTPGYISPEAAIGELADARADVYAAAVILYAMIAGRGPFDHLTLSREVLSAHAFEPPAPASYYAPGLVPIELDRALLRGLEKNPELRFQSAEEFRTELLLFDQQVQLPAGWLETSGVNVVTDTDDSAAGEEPSGEPGFALSGRTLLDQRELEGAKSAAPASALPSTAIRNQPSRKYATVGELAVLFVTAAIVTAALTLALGTRL